MGGKGIGKLLLEEMADQMSACGAASGVLDLPNLRATIYTINPQGWIGIELAPREGGLQVPQ